MAFIRAISIDEDGEQVEQKHEAPKEKKTKRTAVAYLKSSGKTYVNPMYAIGSRREAHLGTDGQGNEYHADQKWVYDLQEAAELEKQFPDRLVRTES